MEKYFSHIEDNYLSICEKIAQSAEHSGRNFEDILFTAVTKTVDSKLVNQSIISGIKSIGENRVQEFLSKYESYNLDNVKINFIGSLQKNKVKYICDKVDCIESVNSLSLAEEIQNRCKAIDKTMSVLIEVNLENEVTKTGISQDGLYEDLEKMSLMPNIKICGLMCIPPFSANVNEKRKYCYKMNKLFVDIKGKKMDNVFMQRLSMGMSDDFEVAILEGSTEVRIGSALFGLRK